MHGADLGNLRELAALMPVIQQERGVKSVAGLPLRWGRRAYRELSAALREDGAESDRYKNLAHLLDEVTAAPLPLDATDAHLCVLAERYANDCAAYGAFIHEPAALRAKHAAICGLYGIKPPAVTDDAQAIARCTDPAWWRRNLRKTHGRVFEAAAIRLGFVSVRAGAYASDETVARRIGQVARNRAALESVTIKNEDGFECTLADAASKTTSNKKIRRGELMLRLAGCEAIANELGHVGVFVTMTAPAKYHAVIQKSGALNRKYNDSTPRQVQGYLQKTWARSRTDYGKFGIKPYGFRIAEPHHDGCVHWHALLFMPAAQVGWFCSLLEKHFLREDGDEPGAQEQRVQFEIIDSEKGSAAAYIAKYISKNIDDDSEAAHDEFTDENGEAVKIEMPADGARKASQRVDAWAGVWGVRQFQPIGQPPVSVWRELRRVKEAEVINAAAHVRQAWDACQRVMRTDQETGEVTVEKPADYANYIRAQGGVCVGRDYRIGVALEPVRIEGRYGVTNDMGPVGVYDRTGAVVPPYVGPGVFVGPLQPGAVCASTRHTWTQSSAQVGVAVPWSPVNNCTEAKPWPKRPSGADAWFSTAPAPEPVAEFNDEWFDSDEYRAFVQSPMEVALEMIAAEQAGEQKRAQTVWTVPSYAHRQGNRNG